MRPQISLSVQRTSVWPEFLIISIAVVIAFLLGYFYAVAHPLNNQDGARSFAQRLMTPAVNYACTGHFGPIRSAPDATPADAGAINGVLAFLEMSQLDYSCQSFPRQVLATWFFDGIDSFQQVYLPAIGLL